MGRIECGDGEDGEPVGAHRADPDGRRRAGIPAGAWMIDWGGCEAGAASHISVALSKCLSPAGWLKTAVAIEVGARPVIRHTTETCTPTDFSQSGEQGPRCVGLVDEDQASKSTEHVVTVGDIDACHLKNSFVAGYAMPGVNKLLAT